MSDVTAAAIKPASILPKDGRTDRPLWIVMSIMAFMASLALLLTSMSNRTSNDWQNELTGSATVQIYLDESADRSAAIETALTVIQTYNADLDVQALTETETKDLIRPWLGEVDLPDSLPLPVMITVEYDSDQTIDPAALTSALETAGFEAEVDNHNIWGARIKRAARAVRVGTSLILILLLAGSIAATGFATQSAMAVHRKVVKVLTQVGAQDRFIAQLFVTRFFGIGAKAGLVGIGGAFIFTFLIAILFGRETDTSLLPTLKFAASDLIYLALIPALFGVVSAIAAGLTSLQVLKSDRQSV